MKNAYISLALILFLTANLQAQIEFSINKNDRETSSFDPVNSVQAPFYHGVASGDPLTDRVIIWTRVTPPTDQTVIVDYEVADDVDFTTIVSSGQVTTDTLKDYTVKVDATGLSAGTTYYYRFSALGATSIIGRTKTLETTNVDHIKLAMVSCNNYQSGYFTVFQELSKRNDLDAVVHLGDFIYEYQTGGYGYFGDTNRVHVPSYEILDISDYRTRYSHYRLDANLQEAMRQHPFIHIWDDHEVANDAWKDGAGNHNAGEGLYQDRKAWAIQAYFEWVPVRDNATNDVYRGLRFGDLLDLVLLDTRHLARSIQVDSFLDPDRLDPNRELLGPAQMAWFKDQLQDNTTTWKVVGNQVVFSQLLLENVETIQPGVRDLFLDVWNGYPTRRDTVIHFIRDNNINNVVFATGDVHISLGFDVSADPTDSLGYDPATGAGSLAVEIVTPSISSDNFDEIVGPLNTAVLEGLFPAGNPHNKYLNFTKHGYYVLDVTPTRAQGDFYHVTQVRVPNETESFSAGVYTDVNTNHLNVTNTPAAPKAVQEVPAPPIAVSTEDLPPSVLLLSTYPNPTEGHVTINYALLESGPINIQLTDLQGRTVSQLFDHMISKGNYVLRFNLDDLPSGVYFVQFKTKDGISAKKLLKH